MSGDSQAAASENASPMCRGRVLLVGIMSNDAPMPYCNIPSPLTAPGPLLAAFGETGNDGWSAMAEGSCCENAKACGGPVGYGGSCAGAAPAGPPLFGTAYGEVLKLWLGVLVPRGMALGFAPCGSMGWKKLGRGPPKSIMGLKKVRWAPEVDWLARGSVSGPFGSSEN